MRVAGAIILARHGEPALSRKVRLSAAQYRDWWARYEEGGLKVDQAAPADLIAVAATAGIILSSTRERARQSAALLAPGRAIIFDPTLIEAPLPSPPLPTWIRLSPRYWGVVARMCWWFFNYHDGQESRAQAERRAYAAARGIVARATAGEDVLVVAHGFFNAMLGRALIAMGWRRAFGRGYDYWSLRRFEGPNRRGD